MPRIWVLLSTIFSALPDTESALVIMFTSGCIAVISRFQIHFTQTYITINCCALETRDK